MQKYLFKNILVVNEGKTQRFDVLINNDRIEKIDRNIDVKSRCLEINGETKHLLPGAIDDQVHFREPGLTHKADILSESKAAVAGGVTTFMEMPNTIPNTLTVDLLEEKYAIASKNSVANYSFYMGVSNTNADEVLKINERRNDVCGIKIFMGASTGNMLVDNYLTLDRIFRESGVLIATHCEDERIIRSNYKKLKAEKPNLEPSDHPAIRDEDACFESSFTAIQFAKKYNSRLHILHISTEKELQLFSNMLPLREKLITAEVCVHHLYFSSDDYNQLGYKIKCNPAIKAPHNREALWKALLDDRLDVIATDHAPHLAEEKTGAYEHAHAGLPLVQHSYLMMLDACAEGKITIEKVVQKMCHAVADCFRIKDRGYIREGYYADLVVVDLSSSTEVTKQNILYKCGWSPLEGKKFRSKIEQTFVSGCRVHGYESTDELRAGKRLEFER
jgi:dihydroorotase